MPDPTTDLDALVARMRELHVPDPEEPGSCFMEYPCEMPQLLDALDALRTRLAQMAGERDAAVKGQRDAMGVTLERDAAQARVRALVAAAQAVLEALERGEATLVAAWGTPQVADAYAEAWGAARFAMMELRAALTAPDAAPVARERARDAVVAAARAYIAVRDVWQPDAMTEGDVFRALPDQAQREADAETRLRTALDALAAPERGDG